MKLINTAHDISDITVNQESRLYTIQTKQPHGFHTCIGFDVLENKIERLKQEIFKVANITIEERGQIGQPQRYLDYENLLIAAKDFHAKTSHIFTCELIPELKGKEKQKVEIIDEWGIKQRFIVGRSSGFIPVHITLKRKDSRDGGAVCIGVPQSIKVLR